MKAGFTLVLGLFVARASLAQYQVHEVFAPLGYGEPMLNAALNGRLFGSAVHRSTGSKRAFAWDMLTGLGTDVHPTSVGGREALHSEVLGASGNYWVGTTRGLSNDDNNARRATLWESGDSSAINLHPYHLSYYQSRALATNGSSHVGYLELSENPSDHHAALWIGQSAEVAVLHPGSGTHSEAFALSETRQYGHVDNHAARWEGSVGSYRDIRPAGSFASTVFSASGSTLGGVYSPSMGVQHAGLWNDQAGQFWDLNPMAALSSEIRSVAGDFRAGYFATASSPLGRACLWRGTSTSVVDLHQLLPDKYILSTALGVTADGAVIGVGLTDTFQQGVFQWTPVPEPGTWMTLALPMMAVLRRRLRA